MVEAAVVAGVADHPFLCRPECRRAAAVEVEGVREPQQAGDVSRFGDRSAGSLAFGAAVDHGHHHLAVRALADQRTRVAVGIEAVAGVVFDDLASADQQGPGCERRAVAAGYVGVLGGVAGENGDVVPLFVPDGDDAVGAHEFAGRRAAQYPAVDHHEGDGRKGFHVEIAAVDGCCGVGGFAHAARGFTLAVELYDLRGEVPCGVADDRDALPRTEHLDLGVAARGTPAEVGGMPVGGDEGDGVAGRLCRGREGEQEQQGCEEYSGHSCSVVDGFKFNE